MVLMLVEVRRLGYNTTKEEGEEVNKSERRKKSGGVKN